MAATASIILDNRRMKIKTGTYPVKLRVTFQRATQHYQTIFDLSKGDYDKLSAPRVSEWLQAIREKLRLLQRACDEFIEEMTAFSFYEFERDYITNHELFKARKKLKELPTIVASGNDFDYSIYYKRFPIFKEDHSRPGTISIVYLRYIKMLLEEERIGTAISYRDSYSSLKKFKGNVLFTEITISYLHQFEKWMLNKGKSKTTVGIKLRNLRAIFNEAIEMGIIKREKCYPFGRRRYQIPTGRNIKKALSQDHISTIYYYNPDCPDEREAKDFWFFCYLGNGMNPKDVAYLKYKDIHDDYLVFVRAKTERATRNDPKPITVFINDDMRRTIERWGNKDKRPDNYIFPVMDDRLNPLEQYDRIPAFTQFINDKMERIGKYLGIEKKLTTIVSRHSFSTQLKRSGVSTEFIQEALGHSDKRTTENYLDSFDKEVKKEYANNLLAFKDTKEMPVATAV